MFIMVLAMFACTTDNTFTLNSANRLTFSTDTVSLDTVFSRVPSSTRTFWVYNNSGNGIRCSSIKLMNGNQTGFRVNVNGVYLGEAQGFQIADEEIRRGDSLRVFVEVTTPLNNSTMPQSVTDDLVFLLESGTTQKVHLKVCSWDADLLKDVVIDTDSTLSVSSRPMVVHGGITVKEGATLTIPAGKTIYMHSGAGIDVSGRLRCLGKAGSEVVIRGDRLDRMFDYLPYDGVSGQWDGIRFHAGSYGNEILFTDIHAASTAIQCDSSDVSRQKLTIISSTIHNCKGDGISTTMSRIGIENTQITNTLGNCVGIVGGAVDMNNCTIAQFYPFDGRRGDALNVRNVGYANGSLCDYPLTEMNVRNSIVTGYADDVIMVSLKDSIPSEYIFSSSLLRTPAVEDSLRCRDIIWENPEDTIVAGWKNFVTVDSDLLKYDFHLREGSLAIDKADKATSMPTDRNATKRDDTPDMGCFEAIQATAGNSGSKTADGKK